MTPPAASRPRLLPLAALALLAVAYLWFVRLHTGYLASGSDASGYLNVARLLRTGELVGQVPRLDGLEPPAWDYFFQQPLGFAVDSSTGHIVPTYAIGLPLHWIAAAPFVGLDYAPMAVNLLLAAAAGALMLALGRQCALPWSWSLAGVALLWCCPLFILFILQPMSDACATVWTLAALSAALQTRRHVAWAFAAGLALAIAVLVRPSSLMLLAPLALVFRLNLRAWLALAAAGLPGAALLAWYNHTLYGSAFASGYGNVDALFSFAYVPHNAAHFALWLTLLLSPLVALPFLGLPFARRESGSIAAMLAVWFAAITGFYVFYYHSGETWWYLRFILPAFPAVILIALLVVRHAIQRHPVLAGKPWLLPVLLLIALAWETAAGRTLHVADVKHGEPPYRESARWMQAHAAPDAIVLQMQLSGAFAYYTQCTIVRWDMVEPAGWSLLQKIARTQRRPIYATLFDFETDRAFTRCPNPRWQRVAQVHGVSIWRLDAPPPNG